MRWIIGLTCVGLALAGCNAVLGISEGTLHNDAGSAGHGGAGGASAEASADARAEASADAHAEASAEASAGDSGASGGTGGNTGGENCTNGKDDNGNGKIDCADPGCANVGYKCQTIPSGWRGPIALYLGAYAVPPPSCDGAGKYPSALLTGVSDPSVPAQCNCSCTLTHLTCEAPNGMVYDNASCGSGLAGNLDFAIYDAGTCVRFAEPDGGFTPGSESVYVTPFATGGSCTPSQVVVTKPSPWKDKALACSVPAGGWQAGGCTSGTMCVPPAPSGFNKGTCIYKSGDFPCPSPSVFSNKYLLYDNQVATDTRGCTACQCGAPYGRCSGKVELFGPTSPSCIGTPVKTLDYAGTCQTGGVPNPFYGDYALDTNQPKVVCPVSPNGGVPTGGVTLSGTPTTVCCPH